MIVVSWAFSPLPPPFISGRFPANRCWWRPSVHLVFFVAHGSDGYGSHCVSARAVDWLGFIFIVLSNG